MTLLTFRNWLVASIVWAGFVAVLAMMNWPRLPFDMSPDPATLKLLEQATWEHVAIHAGLAIVPPLVAYLIGRVVCASGAKAR